MKTKILFVCVVMAGIFLVSCKSGEKNNVLTAAEEAEGWKLSVSYTHLDVYKRQGYLFMCAKDDLSGRHNFASTHTEHARNAVRYQRALDERKIY